MESKTTLTPDRWDDLHEILDNISASVTQELKCKKPRQDNMPQQRPIKQASKFRIVDQQKISQTSEALQAVKLATPNQSTALYTQDLTQTTKGKKRVRCFIKSTNTVNLSTYKLTTAEEKSTK